MAERSGFRILLYILTGLGALLVLTCGTAAYFAWQNPAFREGLTAAMEARTAPGSQALRDAGCGEAAVMDVGAVLDAFGEIAENEPPPADTPTTYVYCQSAGTTELDCDGIATIYRGAVDAVPDRFVVHVDAADGSEPCQFVYDAAGQRLGGLDDFMQQGQEASEGSDGS